MLAGASVLLARLVAWARARQARVGSFTLRMGHERQRQAQVPATELHVELAEPALDAAHLQLLLRERLGRCQLAAPTLELQLRCRHLVVGAAEEVEASVRALPHAIARSVGRQPRIEEVGSEAGLAAVVAENNTHPKRTVFGPKILAKAVFADPGLTLGLPPAVTAATGMDALTHNIESYLSPAYHPLCDGIALEGLRIGARALLTAVQEPGNLQARADMMMSSMMGAIAFQKDLGSVHACAHGLGAVANLPHGLANALMIDTVLAWNFEAVPQKFDELAHAAGVAGGGPAFMGWLKYLKQQVGITGGLAAHGLTEAMLPRLAPLAAADFTRSTNPRPAVAADHERLFPHAM